MVLRLKSGLLCEVQMHLSSFLAIKEEGEITVGKDGLSGHRRYMLRREVDERRYLFRKRVPAAVPTKRSSLTRRASLKVGGVELSGTNLMINNPMINAKKI